MRYIVLVLTLLVGLILILFIGCGSQSINKSIPDISKPDISNLLNKLEELGYYKYIDSSQIDEVKKNSLDAGYVFGWEESGRDFLEDAESLAEGGISEFYDRIKEFLKKQNIDINESEEFSDKGYKISVNGWDYVIYTEDELKSQNIWELSTLRSFSIINNLLKLSNSNERIYILYGGNDLRAIFLTDEMYKIIIESGVLPENELPREVPDSF